MLHAQLTIGVLVLRIIIFRYIYTMSISGEQADLSLGCWPMQ